MDSKNRLFNCVVKAKAAGDTKVKALDDKSSEVSSVRASIVSLSSLCRAPFLKEISLTLLTFRKVAGEEGRKVQFDDIKSRESITGNDSGNPSVKERYGHLSQVAIFVVSGIPSGMTAMFDESHSIVGVMEAEIDDVAL